MYLFEINQLNNDATRTFVTLFRGSVSQADDFCDAMEETHIGMMFEARLSARRTPSRDDFVVTSI